MYLFIGKIKMNDYTCRYISMGKAILGAFAAALLMKFLILDFVVVDGYSMNPAIKPGTIVLVCKIFYGLKLPGSINYIVKWRFPREGDVVVFYTPLGEMAVKRCVEVLPDGFHAWGDNSSQSYDSRDYGLVPHGNIIGKVLGIK